MTHPNEALAKTLEVLVRTQDLDPAKWLDFPEYGFRQYFLWKNTETGASIALLDYQKGGRIPVKHSHASNQFMYCLEGDYEYTDSKLRLTAGSFYMNPKDHPHGPTIAHARSLLIEIYDGPHYYEKPVFHTDETIGGLLSKK
ncbi:MAG: cupin domain-containing protein [Reyranella sp.]|jgi:quercetin dioxygenase-like cupin family protein|uniref:cupin domain-containing protein n=1 Tax=Reyranella sp. TaxID=1929291 RepID=UPI0025FEF961|nr:cupin domain-containing protein [Reyranella sp.]MBR2815192.1 cupin domain-containing protein [Reyranella sp.]